MIIAINLPRRPQPSTDADQKCENKPRVRRGRAIHISHRLDDPPCDCQKRTAATPTGAAPPPPATANAELLLANVAAHAPTAKKVRESSAGDAIRTENITNKTTAVNGKHVAIYNRYWPSQNKKKRHSKMLDQMLADSGAQIDLVGHNRIDLNTLTKYLNIDLNNYRLRIIPNINKTSLSTFTTKYNLLVNTSYMSAMTNKATKSIYLYYFPTPRDHNLTS